MGREKRSKFANDAKSTADLASSLAQKVTKAEVDISLNGKRDKAILISQNDITDELKQQIVGTTPINAVPAKGSLTADRFYPKSTNENAIRFIKHGKNYFDKSAVVGEYQLDTTTGGLVAWANRSTSDFILLDNTKSYYNSSFLRAWCFYDSSYNFISGGLTQFTNKILVIPANAVFFRFTMDNAEMPNVQLEEGTVKTAYEPYKLILDKNDYTDNLKSLNDLSFGLGNSVDLGTLEKSTGNFTDYRGYSGTFLGWAYEFKKSNFTKDITRIEAFVTIGTNTNKEITLVILGTDRVTEIYSVKKVFSGSGKINFNVKIPLSLLPDTFYIGYKTDGTHGIMPANATIDAGYTTGGTYYYTTGYNLAAVGYNATDIKVFTGYETKIKPHTHTMAEITDLTIAANKVTLSLPDKYELIVGDKFELFYKGIILANDPYHYNIKVISSKGYAFKRKYDYTPVMGDVGTHTLTISLYDDNDVLLDTKTVNLIVKAKATNPASIKNVLCVGDSLTAGGQWVTELQRKIVTVDGLTNARFIGTQGTDPAKYEGYGGWTIASYIANMTSTSIVWINGTHDKDVTDQWSIYQDTNGSQWKLETIQAGKIKVIRTSGTTAMPASGTLTWVSGGTHSSNIVFTSTTSESGNPFWNESTSQVDFANYATELGISSIDHVYVLIGWNSTGDTESNYKANVRTFINKLRASFPNSKVTLVGIQVADIDGLGLNYGASWNFKDTLKFVFNLNRWLKEVAAEFTDVDFVNLAGQFDTEYNMPYTNSAVNVRNSTTERRGTNGVHPANEGYMQIADSVYRNIHHKL
jgi:lysophospholipase L1-like esterase